MRKILHSFQWDDALSWRKIFLIFINIHFKECHDRKKKHNGVCKWILINLKWCWNLLAEGTIFFWVCIRVEGLFQTITTALFLQTDTSKGMHKVRSQFLSGISCFLKNTTWDHRYWRIVCKNKCRTHVLYFVSIFGIVFETRQILQNTRWK